MKLGEEYAVYANTLRGAGFECVERDDRLLDVFPKESREKGVELWVKEDGDTTYIIRSRIPFQESLLAMYAVSTTQLEEALLRNKEKDLREYTDASNMLRDMIG